MTQGQMGGSSERRRLGVQVGEFIVSESGKQASLPITSRISWPELKYAGQER